MKQTTEKSYAVIGGDFNWTGTYEMQQVTSPGPKKTDHIGAQ